MLAEIIAAADENFVTHVTWLQRRTPGMLVHDAADVVWTDSGLECDTFNVICRARSPRIDEVLAHFGARPFSWWVGPGDRPANLGELLEDAGLSSVESELAMFVSLDEVTPRDTPLRIERVRTREQLRAFAELTADANVIAFYERVASTALSDDCAQRFYLGYLDVIPIATCEVTLSGATAGVYNVSTLAAHRGRGFGSAMTAHPLLEARRDGARIGVLQAAAAGVSIYQRIGFETYGSFTEFKR